MIVVFLCLAMFSPSAAAHAAQNAVVTQPENADAVVGDSVSFTAESNLSNATVQWYFRHPSMTAFAAAGEPTAQAPTLVLPSSSVIIANNGVQFKAVFRNSSQSIESAVATLTVRSSRDFAIVRQPDNATARIGDEVRFTADVSVPSATVQWFYRHPSMPGFAPAGESTARSRTLILAPSATTFSNAGTEFKAVFTSGSAQATTRSVTLSIGSSSVQPAVISPSRYSMPGAAAGFVATVPVENAQVQWLYKHPSMAAYAAAGETPSNRNEAGATFSTLVLPSAAVTSSNSGVQFKAVFKANGRYYETPASTLTVIGAQASNCTTLLCDLTLASSQGMPLIADPDFGATLVASKAYADTRAKWSFLDQGDGVLHIKNVGTGECLVAGNNDIDFPLAYREACDTAKKAQSWILSPGTDGGYWIRSLATGRCMDVKSGVYDTPHADRAPVQMKMCGGFDHQSIQITGASEALLTDIMTQAALKSCNEASLHLVTCEYVQGTVKQARLDAPQLVSGYSYNDGSLASTLTLGWNASKTVTQSVQSTYSVGSTLTFNFDPFGSIAATAGWSLATTEGWSDLSGTSGSMAISVPPRSFGWIVRAQVVREVTGTWRFRAENSDKSWEAAATSVISAKEGTGGVSSILVSCDSTSTSPACVKSAPVAPGWLK